MTKPEDAPKDQEPRCPAATVSPQAGSIIQCGIQLINKGLMKGSVLKAAVSLG